MTPPTRSLVRRIGTSSFGEGLARRLPTSAWYALDRLGVHPSPARGLERSVAKGVDTFMIYGDIDPGLLQLRKRGALVLRRLTATDHFWLEVVPGLDHAATVRRHRERMADLLTEHVVSRYT